MGTQQPIAQPYNTASMYTNLMPPPPPKYAEGGDVKPSAESAAMIDAQRAAMIAQAQALGQTGYTPTNPGSYGVERGSYTPSTGFAEFTQQYMRNNPAPVTRASTTTSTPTSAPVSPAPTDSTGTAAPTVAATSAPTTIIDYAQQQLDDNYLSRINPVQPPVDNFQTSIDNLQTSMGGYQPPMDNFQTSMDNFQTSVGGYQPPMETFQPMAAASQPAINTYQPTYQEPSYQEPSYQAPTVYDYAGLNTGGGGGPLQDSYSPFGESSLNNDFMQSSFNAGGIASLRSGGYPRRTGQISGPGTATSDSIPAMLSDGEFVMTAKAVRGAGKGDRRAGAKRMYALMNQLEQNAARG
jgi:hypothetical protein